MFPKLVSIGSFYIPTYGVLVALGFLAGLAITTRLARRVNLPADKITNLAVYCTIAGIAGAKLFMFLFDLPEYLRDPGQIFTIPHTSPPESIDPKRRKPLTPDEVAAVLQKLVGA